jgi:hypothetical protein
VTLETRYAQTDQINIAYQVVGEGPLDLVFVIGWVSHIDYFWEEPSFARFLRRLASFARLILFTSAERGYPTVSRPGNFRRSSSAWRTCTP